MAKVAQNPRNVYFFKTNTIGGKARLKEPVKLAGDAEALLSPSRKRVLIMVTGKSGNGKSTVLDILIRRPGLAPQTSLQEPFVAGEGHEGLTRSVHLYGPIPLVEFCRIWDLAPAGDTEIDLFFIDTEGTDSDDSDRVAMSVLPILGSVVDIRLCVMCKRPLVSDITDLMNGIKATSFLSSVRSTAIAVVVRQCGPGDSRPGDANRHERRVAQDGEFTNKLRNAATRAEMTHLFQPDDSRFVAFCQPCWHDDPKEHRSSMIDLAHFVVRSALATPPVGIGWIISTIRKVSSEISRRTGGEGIVNETEIWNSLLGTACNDAEQEVTIKYAGEALTKLSALPDLDSANLFDVVVNRDEMFRRAQGEFRSKCTGERADLLELIPVLSRGAEGRIREIIEQHLHRYRAELSHILRCPSGKPERP
jgi:hypothetical protein